MARAHSPEDLTGKLLIAMPDIGDPRFHGSVVFLCAHSADGAMGLIVNKPMPEIAFADMLGQLDIKHGPDTPNLPICYGGPVSLRRGFVLHGADYAGVQDDRLQVDARFALTATVDVLQDLARGVGPAEALLALGYTGWGPGQLEGEIAQNGWLTADATPALVFDSPMEGKWVAALASLGISPLTLSATAGHA